MRTSTGLPRARRSSCSAEEPASRLRLDVLSDPERVVGVEPRSLTSARRGSCRGRRRGRGPGPRPSSCSRRRPRLSTDAGPPSSRAPAALPRWPGPGRPRRHRSPGGLSVPPGYVRRCDVVGRAVDGVEVHRRLDRRQLAPYFAWIGQCLVRDLLDEVGSPVPLVAGEDRGRRRRPGSQDAASAAGPCSNGAGTLVEQRCHRAGRCSLVVTDVAPYDPADLPSVQLLRERPSAGGTLPTRRGRSR